LVVVKIVAVVNADVDVAADAKEFNILLL